MNANQLINMVVRLVMRQLLARGVNAGIDAISSRGQKPEPTAENQAQRKQADETSKRLRQTSKIARRMGRF